MLTLRTLKSLVTPITLTPVTTIHIKYSLSTCDILTTKRTPNTSSLRKKITKENGDAPGL